MENIATAFRDSDGAGVFADLVRCLDFMNDLPFFKAYKAATWPRLDIKKSSRILDVGCGVGFDVIGMATLYPSSEIWGVDISDRFIEIARSRAKNLSNEPLAKRLVLSGLGALLGPAGRP
jgi:ubiquinone/menaquinone biosynthesis C-methylase UbiE